MPPHINFRRTTDRPPRTPPAPPQAISALTDAAKERLDHYLVRTGFAPSRRVAQELVERGLVRINGRRSKKSEIVGAEDRIEVAATNRRAVIEPNGDLPLEVVHEDASVIVVNKPGGMPCHPLNTDERDTVMNAVVARFPEIATVGEKPLEGGLVHRLDNGTSGALLIARNRGTFDKLRDAIRAGRIARRYEALVAGALEHKTEIDAPIAHHAKNARKMIVGDPSSANPKRAGRAASTLVDPIRRVGEFTLLSIAPKTGSRHQIRVHLASIGHPIVGDTLYGGPPSETLAHGRFWLHLCDVAFDSPAVGHVKVTAPIPPDLKMLIE
jgi:23S rRNA pseudouridine1911/1915/1917 synthase